MKKILKRMSLLVLISGFILPQLLLPFTYVRAKTINDLQAELNKTKADLEKNKQEKAITEQEINNTKNSIENINKSIEQIGKQMVTLSDEIEQLNLDIDNKEEEIKRIINLLQISNGESMYMEYIFGAKDFTDFIYRSAIAEQMSDYNDKLIDQYNKMIEENKQKQKELEQKRKDQQQKQADLKVQLDKLGTKRSSLYDVGVDLEDAVKQQEEYINNLKKMGCRTDVDISKCNTLPPDTKFWRPVDSGIVSSTFGYRTYWLNGREVTDYHSGTDIAAGLGSNVYSTASGKVVLLTYRYHCGGNMVWIQHNINGKNYTSVYMHLQYYTVNVGDIVTKNTVIGKVGGDPSVTWWDGCSTGAHVHYTLLNGLVGTDYDPWSSQFYSSLIDPQHYANLPSNTWFTNRTTKY